MGKVLAFVVNKGGVGKTSLVTNIASALHVQDPRKRILIVDADAQGNCAVSFNLDPDEIQNTLYDCMVNGLPTKEAIIELKENLYLLPSNDDMNFFELDVLPNLGGKFPFGFLERVLDQVHGQFDYVFIDSPPDLKMVALNIIKVADYIYIPFKPETYSVKGLIRVVNKINEAKEKIGSHAQIGGIIGMMIKRTKLHSNMMLQADAFCKKNNIHLFETRIPETIRYADSIALFGMPEVLADPKSPYSKLYFDLLEEMKHHAAW